MITRFEFLKLLWPPIFLPLLFGRSNFIFPPSWEYKIVIPDRDLLETLQYHGQFGWELTNKEGSELIFKRQKFVK